MEVAIGLLSCALVLTEWGDSPGRQFGSHFLRACASSLRYSVSRDDSMQMIQLVPVCRFGRDPEFDLGWSSRCVGESMYRSE